jgi:hypothetical protein
VQINFPCISTWPDVEFGIGAISVVLAVLVIWPLKDRQRLLRPPCISKAPAIMLNQQVGAPTVPSTFIESSREWGHSNYVIQVKLCNLCQIMSSGARVSSISSRGDGLNPNLLYPPLEEEGKFGRRAHMHDLKSGCPVLSAYTKATPSRIFKRAH